VLTKQGRLPVEKPYQTYQQSQYFVTYRMSSTPAFIATAELLIWLNQAIELLWLLTVFLLLSAFLGQDYAKAETIIA